MPDDFFHPGAQIGVEKLYLLSTLSKEERVEITENMERNLLWIIKKHPVRTARMGATALKGRVSTLAGNMLGRGRHENL